MYLVDELLEVGEAEVVNDVPGANQHRPTVLSVHTSEFKTSFRHRGIHEKGSGDVVSAVCYTIYLPLCTQTAETYDISRTTMK